MTDLFMKRGAVISDCGIYRYRLDRKWGNGPVMGFIMLNPSTADAELDDPTIRRCIGFAKRENCGGVVVVNLFAFRATNPSELNRTPHPVGPEWRDHFDAAVNDITGPVIAAWGAQKGVDSAVFTVKSALKEAGRAAQCLGKTKDGSPRHPLYVCADAPLIPFGA